MMLFTSRGIMPFPKVICPHCNRESADKLVCTSLGCGRKIAGPVRLFTRARKTPRSVGRRNQISPSSRLRNSAL